MILDSDTSEVARKRIGQVFKYLEALNQLRNPVVRQIGEQPWKLWLRDLPAHPAIRRGNPPVSAVSVSDPSASANTEESSSGDDYVLRVRRPAIRPAPAPPEEIVRWLRPGWDKVDGRVDVIPSRNEAGDDGETSEVRFEDDPRRPALLANWGERRDQWAARERPARQAFKVFEDLYELRARIEREGERIEFVLGDGILNWRRPNGGIHHPVLLQRLQLDFDPEEPQFFLRETNQPVEMYSALFRGDPDVDYRAVGRCLDDLEKNSYHPLGGNDTSTFLRGLVTQLSPHGEFVEDGNLQGEEDHPRIGRDPVIFVRSRTQGFATAIEAVLDNLQTRNDFPHSLLNIVGLDPLVEDADFEVAKVRADAGNDDKRILLSKPANQEQLRIAQRLEKYGSVLVQGPPGTGKTHMVGNLIGHLLAQGKSVLVTSHTTKALKRVREQVIAELRALCVSVLENDATNQDELKQSIEAIVERLSSADGDYLEERAEALQSQRAAILERLQNARDQLSKARGDEYRDVVVAGEAYSPADAARLVAAGREQDAWIPGQISLGDPLPLPAGELIDLYQTNVTVTAEDQEELTLPLPEPEQMLLPEAFGRLVEERRSLLERDLRLREDLWKPSAKGVDPEEIERLLARVLQAMEVIQDAPGWKLETVLAGWRGGPHRRPWDSLLAQISEAVSECALGSELILAHGPQLSEAHPLPTQVKLLGEIIAHLEGGKKLSTLTLLMHSDWKGLISKSKVHSGQPQELPHFLALRAMANSQATRRDLVLRWESQMVPHGGPSPTELGDKPELACAQYTAPLQAALDWHEKTFGPLTEALEQNGFAWDQLLQEVPPDLSPYGDLHRIAEAAGTCLPPILASRAAQLCWDRMENALAALERTLSLASSGESSSLVVRNLQQAVRDLDSELYRQGFVRLLDLRGRRRALELRQALLGRIEPVAAAWAAAIRNRQAPHDLQAPPGDPARAWLWRQLNDELENRARLSLPAIQSEIADLNRQLHAVTTELIDSKAWAAQVKRTGLKQRQDLMGWLKTTQKIGKGTGKWVPLLRAEARRLMGECREAVPVWVMSLARMVENFDPRTARFDVVIIDEASQSDAMALIAFYLGKQVVVVGDQEQVSPDAVGTEASVIQGLIAAHLQGVPNALLYSPQTSIYDLAQTAFGATICLKEHFRCVPEIIQFSNDLSYGGEIKPLRDASSVLLKPHVVGYRVEGAHSSGGTNEKEALALVSLLMAATEQPEYRDKTFGVISLVGDQQAYLIDKQLRTYLSPAAYEERRIVCGNPAHFQGDERHVMFLSMVDGANGGPLAMRSTPMFKKRFNVAASRAQDQMWVVYSLDPKTDLKAGDLRRRLIEHAQDPTALMRHLQQGGQSVESEFERLVLRRLASEGYRVTSQWKVGHYRIDMVVEGARKRLAVECDGDKYHPLEKLDEDMARQAILERMGWTFVRIRGSQFFRNPDLAMQPVYDRLEAMGIPPEGITADAPAGYGEEDLKRRVIRRAAELRREWTGEADSLLDETVQDVAADSDQRNGQPPARIVDPTTEATLNDQSEEAVQDNASLNGDGASTAGATDPPPPAPASVTSEQSPETPVDPPLKTDHENRPARDGTYPGLDDVAAYLSQKGLTVIDRRALGGALWIVGGQELAPLMKALDSKGFHFVFAASGGRATHRAPGWWAK